MYVKNQNHVCSNGCCPDDYGRLGMLLPMSVKASDTILKLDQTTVALDNKNLAGGAITGRITGDTSSSYYAYAIDEKGIVDIPNGCNLSNNAFSISIKAKKAGTTTVDFFIKDKKFNEVVASETVTVKVYDVSRYVVRDYIQSRPTTVAFALLYCG